ncbi:D-alanyl-D-alanine carboxypeptidase DacB precursor [mine drainage metagenome]|uniref:D-alanyl-D-alanine carboxypeptidase DacB n=1 Tax=mine drainage metagenome TaxID=410659 RepID=A0A1J5R5Y9_9ZZZZ
MIYRFCHCLLALLLASALFLPPVHARAQYRQRLPMPVARALRAAGIPSAAVAVLVRPADSQRPGLSVNADRALDPASVMKLVTTYAALGLLGPAYTWKTEAWIAGRLDHGVLDGDLYLKGGGDPILSYQRFWLLLARLRAMGLTRINGDLVQDRSLFDAGRAVPIDDQPLRPYNVVPDPLLLDFDALRLELVPDPAQDSLAVLPEPLPDGLTIDNLIKPVGGACGDWKGGLRPVLSEIGGQERLSLSGNFPRSCGEQTWRLAGLPHRQYLDGVFRSLWRQLGGSIGGGSRQGIVPSDARLMVSLASPPLAVVIRDINKFSNNVMARQLFLSLGAATGHRPADEADAAAAVRAWLKSRHLDFPELVLDNGSGLSRRARISAESLARLLASAWRDPLMPEFVSSLPLAAEDGTMEKRLRHEAVAGQAHIKTGTLDGVKAIAGYVRDRAGRWQIVVFLVNHPQAARAAAAQDALLQWVYERGG